MTPLRARGAAAFFALAGCGDPISNQVLYEDELFLAALPSVDRLAPPADVRLARVGDSALLRGAVEQAAALEGLAAVVGAAGEALRGATPDERSDAVRAWDAVSTAVRVDDRSVGFWVRGEVLQPGRADGFDWTIEVALERGGPWVPVGQGAHERDDRGRFTWELAAHTALVAPDEPVPPRLVFTYEDATEGRPRALLVEDDDLELGGTWELAGEQHLTWLGGVSLTDGTAPPGAAQVRHVADRGGRGTGVVVTQDGEIPFDVCWDANGDDVWRSGGGLEPFGEANRCDVAL